MGRARRRLAAALLVGALAGSFGAGAALACLAAALAGWLVARRAKRGGPRSSWTATACALALAAGALSALARSQTPPEATDDEPVVARLVGVVTRAPTTPIEGRAEGEREQRLVLRPRAGGARSPLSVEVTLRAAAGETFPGLRPGDVVAVVGRPRVPGPPGNPGETDQRALLARRGVGGRFYVPSPAAVRVLGRVDGPALLARRAAAAARSTLLARLRGAVTDQGHARLLGALLLGEREALGTRRRDAFRSAGVAHVLAVSGLHVVLLVTAGAWVVRRVWPGRRRPLLGMVALTTSLLAYVALCRFGTPVVRAAVFLLVAAVARIAGRRTTTLDHLALAALLVIAADPLQVRETGFHLSFAAVLGLAVLTPRFVESLFPTLAFLERFPEALPRWELCLRRWFAGALAASLAATCATAPVIAATFGAVYPIGPLTNLAVVPLVATALPIAALACAAGGLSPPLTSLAAAIAVGALEAIVGIAAALPAGRLEGAPAPPWAVGTSVVLLLVAARARTWNRWHLLLPGAACVVLALPHPPPDRATGPELIALDVGHGLAVLIRDGERGTLLADAGGRAADIGARRIVPALRALGVSRLDALVLSHDDIDHCGAAPDVLAALPVGRVVVPRGFGDGAPAQAVLAACRRRGVAVRRAARGDRLVVGSLEIRALHPPGAGPGPADNAGSLVLHVRVGRGGTLTALLPGDLEGPPLAAMASDSALPRADVLVLPHHGLGPPQELVALARRAGADVLIASAGPRAPVRVPAALVTGRLGAVRVRPGPLVATWPFVSP